VTTMFSIALCTFFPIISETKLKIHTKQE
jgi:hypothetical protein